MPRIRTAIVYASVHRGNTRRVAEAFAEVLNADLYTVDDVSAAKLASYDLVGYGSGIYYGRHHRRLRQLADNLPGRSRAAFVFSTAGLPYFAVLWHKSLRRKLKRQNWQVVGEFTCPGWDRWGPLILIGGLHRHRPNERDLIRARDFALGLAGDLPATSQAESPQSVTNIEAQ